MSFGLTGTVTTRASQAASLALAFLFVGSLTSRADEPWAPPADGTHVFRAILNQQLGEKLTPIDPSELYEDPKHTLFIIFGTPTWPREWAKLGRGAFLQGGGALFVATDQATSEPWFDRIFATTLNGNFIQTSEPADQYKGLPDCVLVKKPWERPNAPLFKGVSQIATNKPSYLIWRNSSVLKPLAYFPASAREPDLGNMDAFAPANPPGPRQRLLFAAGGDVGDGEDKGRALLLSDHSLFINQMLLPRAAWAQPALPPEAGVIIDDGDLPARGPEREEPGGPRRGPQSPELVKRPVMETEADNFLFACNCVEWMTDNGKRNRILFVEDGKVVSDFRVSLKKPPAPRMPTPQQLIRMGDLALDGLEKEDFFNRQAVALENALGEHRDVFVPLLITAATLLLLLVAASKVGAASRTAPVLANNSAPNGSISRSSRAKAILQEGKYWEAAQFLAAQLAAAAPRGPAPPPKGQPRAAQTAKPISAKRFQALLAEYQTKRPSPRPDNRKQRPRMA